MYVCMYACVCIYIYIYVCVCVCVGCGAVWLSNYKIPHCTTPYGVVRYGSQLSTLWCGYAILRVIMMWFSEHPYLLT